MAKKLLTSKTCLVCGERLMRNNKYAKTYCAEHRKIMEQLKAMRQPCRKVKCKNPAHEDGYCDAHRPFAADQIPMRTDWIEGEGLIKSNNPKCPYYGTTTHGGTYRSKAADETIEEIRSILND